MSKKECRDLEKLDSIEEMIMSLCDHDNFFVLDMLKKEIKNLKTCIKNEKNMDNLEKLQKRVDMLQKGLIVYSDNFCEECVYILNNTKRKER